MDLKENNKYRYTDAAERNRKMNKFYIVASSLLTVVFLFYLWLKLVNHNISPIVTYSNTVLIAIFCVVNTVTCLRNKATRLLKVFATIEIGIEYLLVGLQTDASFIHYALIAIFILQIPYYEKKSLRKTALGLFVLYLVVMIVQASKGIYGQDVNAVCSTLLVFLIGIIILETGKITILFNNDAIGSSQEEHVHVKEVLDNVLDVSQTVHQETSKTTDLMNQLVQTTESVANSMQEISDATNMTATSIEEQSQMTGSIQHAIEQTSHISEQMVQIAEDSNESIRKNMAAMEALKLVYASSSSVYGSNKKVPYSTDDKVDNPVSLYAATKKSNELMAHAYSKLYNIPSTGLRFFTVYGPAGRPDMAYFGFTNMLVNGETIKIFNYGNCKRDFTYVDDIVEGVVRVMKKPPEKKNGEDGLPIPPYAIYNIGNSNPENLLDFVQILSEELVRAGVLPADYDFEAHKELVPMQPGDVPVTYADTEPLERDFGFKPHTPLRDGLRKFAEWYKEFYMA